MDEIDLSIYRTEPALQNFFRILWEKNPFAASYPVSDLFWNRLLELDVQEMEVLMYVIKHTFISSGLTEVKEFSYVYPDIRKLISSLDILCQKRFIDKSDIFYHPDLSSKLMFANISGKGLRIAYITEKLIPNSPSKPHLELCLRALSWIAFNPFARISKNSLSRELSTYLGIDEFTSHRVLQTLIDSEILVAAESWLRQNIIADL